MDITTRLQIRTLQTELQDARDHLARARRTDTQAHWRTQTRRLLDQIVALQRPVA